MLAASRSAERRSLLESDFGIPTTERYETVLEDPSIDAVYIALTNARHEAWALRALAAGKHVYCEKPTVLDLAGAARVAALARAQRLVFLEGFMFRFHPQHQAVRELLAAGAIGEPLHLDAWFGIPSLAADNHRLLAAEGGGAFNDTAGYPIQAARLLFGAEPLDSRARRFRSPDQDVDQRGSIVLDFANGRTAHLAYGFGYGYRNAYAIWGSEGILTLERAFSVPPDHAPIILLRDRSARESVRQLAPANHFQEALLAFTAAIRGERPTDAFLDDFESLARLMDRLRKSAPVR